MRADEKGALFGVVLTTVAVAWFGAFAGSSNPPQGSGGGGTTVAFGEDIQLDTVTFVSADTSGSRLEVNTGTLTVREGDDSADAPFQAGGVTVSGDLVAQQDAKLRSDHSLGWSDSASDTTTIDTFLERGAAGQLDVNSSLGGGGDGAVKTDNFIASDTGGVGDLSFGWAGDPDTGIYQSGANQIDFLVGNGLDFKINTSGPQVPSGADLQMSDGTDVAWGDGRLYQAGHFQALTDAVATEILAAQTGDGDMGSLKVDYTIQCNDGSNYQVEMGTVTVAFVDTSGGVTASAVTETSSQAVSAGTIDTTWTLTTTDDGDLELNVNCDTSLTPTYFWCWFTVKYPTGITINY